MAPFGVLRQTTPYVVTNYPRIASSTVMVDHSAATVRPVDARQVYSLNAGGTWSDFSNFVTFAANVAVARYASQSLVAEPRVTNREIQCRSEYKCPGPLLLMLDANPRYGSTAIPARARRSTRAHPVHRDRTRPDTSKMAPIDWREMRPRPTGAE